MNTEQKIYDAIVVSKTASEIAFEDRTGRQYAYASTLGFLEVGEVGCLTLRMTGTEPDFTFHRYPDPALRRAPELDNHALGLWAWRLGDAPEQPVRLVRADMVPGRAGQVIKDTTQKVTIDIPLEFIAMAAMHGLTAEQVLRGFVADLCELQNYVVLPREDGYSSNGSDERRMAQDYFERAYGMY